MAILSRPMAVLSIAVLSRICGQKRQDLQIWATDGQFHRIPYKDFFQQPAELFLSKPAPAATLSRRPASMAVLSRPAKPNGRFMKPMAVLSKPMAILSRPMARGRLREDRGKPRKNRKKSARRPRENREDCGRLRLREDAGGKTAGRPRRRKHIFQSQEAKALPKGIPINSTPKPSKDRRRKQDPVATSSRRPAPVAV